MTSEGAVVTKKRRVKWMAAASLLWLVAEGALAQGPHRPPGRNPNGGGPQRMMPAEPRPDQMSPRESGQQGGNHLSPEERKQLRRDVHEAGRDLYPDRMPPGRREGRRP